MTPSFPQNAERLYRLEALKAMSARERLLVTCDLAWQAANEGEENRLRGLLLLLKMSLRFEKTPIQALAALRTFRHCEEALERGDYPEISRVFFLLKRGLAEPGQAPSGPEAEACREKVLREGMHLRFGRGKPHYAGRATVRVKKTPVAE
jgi:hypothetical protein